MNMNLCFQQPRKTIPLRVLASSWQNTVRVARSPDLLGAILASLGYRYSASDIIYRDKEDESDKNKLSIQSPHIPFISVKTGQKCFSRSASRVTRPAKTRYLVLAPPPTQPVSVHPASAPRGSGTPSRSGQVHSRRSGRQLQPAAGASVWHSRKPVAGQ